MEGVPGPESKQRSWIYAKGGLFIAKRQKSVDPEHPEKEVMALNYRWKSLENRFPNRLLIDEIVQIAEELYLGKLYYATALQYISMDYDPKIRKEEYKYRSFGYFLLMDDSWLHEKNMLFPDLTYKMAYNLPEKFGAFHLIDKGEQAAYIPMIFETKAMALGGFGIHFEKCCKCGRAYSFEGDALFIPEKGSIACLKCHRESTRSPLMGPDCVKAFLEIQSESLTQSKERRWTDNVIKEIKPVLRLHREYHLERRLKTSKYVD